MNVDDYRFLFLSLNIWLCFASALMVFISALVLSIPLSSVGVGLLLPPLLFYFIYAEERRNVSREDEINAPHRTALVRQYQRGLLVTEAIALLAYEGLLVWLSFTWPGVVVSNFALGQLPLLVLLVYGYAKRCPMFDSLAVGATWSFVTVFSLRISAQAELWNLGLLFVAWFVIVFAGVESRNIQDLEGDTETGKTTLAGYLGRQRTLVLVLLLKSLGVLVFWAISDMFVAALVVGYLVLLWLCRTLTRREVARVGA